MLNCQKKNKEKRKKKLKQIYKRQVTTFYFLQGRNGIFRQKNILMSDGKNRECEARRPEDQKARRRYTAADSDKSGPRKKRRKNKRNGKNRNTKKIS